MLSIGIKLYVQIAKGLISSNRLQNMFLQLDVSAYEMKKKLKFFYCIVLGEWIPGRGRLSDYSKFFCTNLAWSRLSATKKIDPSEWSRSHRIVEDKPPYLNYYVGTNASLFTRQNVWIMNLLDIRTDGSVTAFLEKVLSIVVTTAHNKTVWSWTIRIRIVVVRSTNTVKNSDRVSPEIFFNFFLSVSLMGHLMCTNCNTIEISSVSPHDRAQIDTKICINTTSSSNISQSTIPFSVCIRYQNSHIVSNQPRSLLINPIFEQT